MNEQLKKDKEFLENWLNNGTVHYTNQRINNEVKTTVLIIKSLLAAQSRIERAIAVEIIEKLWYNGFQNSEDMKNYIKFKILNQPKQDE